ncbi:MAG: GHKL domain-containing protein [Alphaproteobacteria bacterium]|nr:GHKL domain-containing protein [Alphaproteobacteria bacterium]
MINRDDEFLGIDKSSGFSLRVLALSVPAGVIFLILGVFDLLPVSLALLSYISILFFNTVFLLPLSTEIQQVKRYIQNLAEGENEEALLKKMTEKETRDLTEAINSMHRFWMAKQEQLENRTLTDAAVLDILPDPLVIINKTGNIIGANLAARRLFEVDLTNKDVRGVVNDTGFIAAMEKVLGLEARTAEFRLCLKELKEKPKFYVRIARLSWFAKGEVAAVVSFYDLSKALSVEQMQQDFVANASHELRTPLSIISGFIETLMTTAKDDEKAREKFLKIMSEQTVYMAALIENLLSLSKIELSVATKPVDKVNVNAVIKEVKNALELKFSEQKLTVKIQFARLPKITADEQQVMQVIRNLLDNAVKYATPETEILIATQKAEQVPAHRFYEVGGGSAVEISIANVGVPIAKEDLERLTERFYRLQEHKNKNIKGTGLGLSIAAQIIKRHKGNMLISSEDGVTTFKVYLPFVFEA